MRTYVAVDGGMSDNPRPVLYGAGYEAFLPAADRRARARSSSPSPASTASRATCSSRDAQLPADVAVGDVLATPVTGAYGYSMASNYNKVPRPAVVFVRDGDARVVVRRETLDDLVARDVAEMRRDCIGADGASGCGSGSSAAATSGGALVRLDPRARRRDRGRAPACRSRSRASRCATSTKDRDLPLPRAVLHRRRRARWSATPTSTSSSR